MTPEEMLVARGLGDPVAALGSFLPRQRWFASRPGEATALSIDDAAVVREPDGDTAGVLLTTVTTSYTQGASDTHFVPLAVRRGQADAVADPSWVVGSGVVDGEPVVVYDALGEPAAAVAVHDLLATAEPLPTLRGEVRARSLAAVPPGPATGAADVHPLGREQSNTSLVIGEDRLFKCLRRVEDGISPELEMTEALTDAGFEHVAAPLAVLEYHRPQRSVALLAILQPFLRNGSEGWALALTSLRDLYAEAETDAGELDAAALQRAAEEQGATFLPEAQRLGEITGAMHAALGGEAMPEPMRARAVSAADLDGWATEMTAELDSLLRAGGDALEPLRARREAIIDAFDAIRRLDEAGMAVRIHGDFHLGQTLRTDSGWTILDFEGEPDRPLAERRRLFSPLRDVAGLLRSFDYAAAAALAERCQPDDADWPRLIRRGEAWAEANRRIYWGAYLSRAGLGPLLPGAEQTRALRRAFELQKAVYEVGYELGHRPSWVSIPVGFLVRETS